MFSIGQLAKEFLLSRSTLLYYDEIGLLSPTRRTAANYRVYSADDVSRLQKIVELRGTGISLEQIKMLLDESSESNTNQLFERRLSELNQEISTLKKQQRLLLGMLGRKVLDETTGVMNKDQWVQLLIATGLSEKDMERWHVEFEAQMPDAHQQFLQSLGISDAEITQIRAWSRACTETK